MVILDVLYYSPAGEISKQYLIELYEAAMSKQKEEEEKNEEEKAEEDKKEDGKGIIISDSFISLFYHKNIAGLTDLGTNNSFSSVTS